MSGVEGGWEVRLIDDWQRDGERLVVFRRLGEDRETLVRFSEESGYPILRRDPDATNGPDISELPLLPYGVAEAIAATVRPGPSEAEVGRLEDALAVERGRVDRVLDTLIARDVRSEES
jgi:hypothetical protein